MKSGRCHWCNEEGPMYSRHFCSKKNRMPVCINCGNVVEGNYSEHICTQRDSLSSLSFLFAMKKLPNEHLLEFIKKQEDDSRKISDLNARSLAILKERLAKGEITKEEYDELKKEFT